MHSACNLACCPKAGAYVSEQANDAAKIKIRKFRVGRRDGGFCFHQLAMRALQNPRLLCPYRTFAMFSIFEPIALRTRLLQIAKTHQNLCTWRWNAVKGQGLIEVQISVRRSKFASNTHPIRRPAQRYFAIKRACGKNDKLRVIEAEHARFASPALACDAFCAMHSVRCILCDAFCAMHSVRCILCDERRA